MRDLTDINFWTKDFGLLPLQLNTNVNDIRFIMLNGGGKDFCLQTKANNDDGKGLFFQYSWSTNTKNYITVNNDNVEICNWFDGSVELIERKKVESNVEKFYQYLTTKSFKTESDIIPFVLDIFKQLRNITLETKAC